MYEDDKDYYDEIVTEEKSALDLAREDLISSTGLEDGGIFSDFMEKTETDSPSLLTG